MWYWYQIKIKTQLIPVNTSFYFTSEAVVQRCSVKKVFCKKGVLKNFGKFTGKYQCQSLFLVKLQARGLQLYFIKKETPTVFPCEFFEISKNTSGGCFCNLWNTLINLMVTFFIRCRFKWAISFKYQLHFYLPRFQNFDFQDFLGTPYINW